MSFAIPRIAGLILAVLFTAGAAALIVLRKKRSLQLSKSARFGYRFAVAALVILALEMSVFNISAYLSLPAEEESLMLQDAATDTMMLNAENELALTNYDNNAAVWQMNGQSVGNVTVTLKNNEDIARVVNLSIETADANLSGMTIVYSEEYKIDGETTVCMPVSSKGITQMRLTIASVGQHPLSQLQLSAVRVNVPWSLHVNLLRILLLLLLVGCAMLIKDRGLHKIEYDPKNTAQKIMAAVAVLLCCAALIQIGAAHADTASADTGLLLPYDGIAENKDPYYQMFDAFQKERYDLDIPVDQRLIEAGDKAYDPQYLIDQGISYAWDRAFYDGKYYSYFGVAPLALFYYPVYFITGKLPTTALSCVFFSILCCIFGAMVIFRIARSFVKNGNFLLTLLSAAVLPLMAGVYILTAYGDFYNLPKLCGLAFMMLLYYLTIAGYEKPRWYIFVLCGICVGILMASRPNVLIMALSLAPMYIGILVNKEYGLKKKGLYLVSFLLPIALTAAWVMSYNAARFGSPMEFGAKYQLTVNNIAMNNISLGFLGMAFYHYFLQPADFRTSFPYIVPQLQTSDTYTRYFYVIMAYGVLSLPLNWSLFSYPVVRKHSRIKPAYRYTLILTVVMGILVALLDFALAGVAISYVCDIAMMIAVAAIALLLLCEKASRVNPAVHKGVYIAALVLLLLTFAVCTALLLGTDPYFVKVHMPDTYFNIRSLFRF